MKNNNLLSKATMLALVCAIFIVGTAFISKEKSATNSADPSKYGFLYYFDTDSELKNPVYFISDPVLNYADKDHAEREKLEKKFINEVNLAEGKTVMNIGYHKPHYQSKGEYASWSDFAECRVGIQEAINKEKKDNNEVRIVRVTLYQY